MPINDPKLVREQYKREDNLRARRALYDETTGADPREVLWEAIAAQRPGRVLEVGGGPGELAERIARELHAEVAFLDISPRMVELAAARGLDARAGDVQELELADETFDTVVAAWMLYHVPDIDRGIAELARVLEPGGHLVAVTNSIDHLRELGELIDYPEAARESAFSSENGEEILARHFPQVERIDVDGTVTVRDRGMLVAYRDSLSVQTAPVPDDVAIPFVVRRACTVFVATK